MYKNLEYVKNKLVGGSKSTPPAPVILGRDAQSVPRILWLHGTNLVNKFALLLHKYWLREDSWDKPKNDGCWGRMLSAFSTFTIKAMSILTFLGLFATAAEAKICFLPDGSSGTSKTTGFKQNPNGSGCMYKTDAEARNGLGACETTYKQNMCYYRRCKTEDNNIFADAESCKKKAEDNNLICVSCGGCYKVTPKTCPSGYTAGLTTCAEKAGYTASYSSNGYVGYSVCGKCKYTIKPCESGYTVGLASCPEKQGYTSDYSRNGVSGEQVCGKCDYTAKSCAGGYTAGLTSCSERQGYTASLVSNGYAGELACGKCDYTARTCPYGYSTIYSSVSACGSTGSEGWNYYTNGYSGEAVCGQCTAKTCPSGYNCWSYSDDLLGESCNTSTRCPGDSGYYYFNGVLNMISTCSGSGYWAHVSGRCGNGICIKYGRLTCPNGGTSSYDVDNVYEYCRNKNGAKWSARSMKNTDGSYMCTGAKVCYECYRR